MLVKRQSEDSVGSRGLYGWDRLGVYYICRLVWPIRGYRALYATPFPWDCDGISWASGFVDFNQLPHAQDGFSSVGTHFVDHLWSEKVFRLLSARWKKCDCCRKRDRKGVSHGPAGKSDTFGVMKAVVRQDSKAYQKGIRMSDCLISVNGEPITDYCTYLNLVEDGEMKRCVYRTQEGAIKEVGWKTSNSLNSLISPTKFADYRHSAKQEKPNRVSTPSGRTKQSVFKSAGFIPFLTLK